MERAGKQHAWPFLNPSVLSLSYTLSQYGQISLWYCQSKGSKQLAVLMSSLFESLVGIRLRLESSWTPEKIRIDWKTKGGAFSPLKSVMTPIKLTAGRRENAAHYISNMPSLMPTLQDPASHWPGINVRPVPNARSYLPLGLGNRPGSRVVPILIRNRFHSVPHPRARYQSLLCPNFSDMKLTRLSHLPSFVKRVDENRVTAVLGGVDG